MLPEEPSESLSWFMEKRPRWENGGNTNEIWKPHPNYTQGIISSHKKSFVKHLRYFFCKFKIYPVNYSKSIFLRIKTPGILIGISWSCSCTNTCLRVIFFASNRPWLCWKKFKVHFSRWMHLQKKWLILKWSCQWGFIKYGWWIVLILKWSKWNI